ncbi:MAG: type II toxin-antitoxin system RelE/ParE family toxin [Burkholderiales bacterium]|nr:type II toxin-antitoxin system RelE/ParE family toxin [Burkholderiales bacterium]
MSPAHVRCAVVGTLPGRTLDFTRSRNCPAGSRNGAVRRGSAVRPSASLVALRQAGGVVKRTGHPWPPGIYSKYAIIRWNGRLPSKGAEGIARVFYCTAVHRRIVVLHQFVKKTDKAPRKELAIARSRMKEFS